MFADNRVSLSLYRRVMKEFITLALLSWITSAHCQGQPRIMNGTPANVGQFPYQAYVSDDSIGCGASIIHERWLLTAAHCRPHMHTAYAIVGTVDKTGVSGMRLDFEKFIQHKGYAVKESEIINDIALIRLKEDLKFSDTVKPIKLATDKSNDYAGVTATLSGWGLRFPSGGPQVHLQYASLQVVGQKDCSSLWRTNLKNKICTAGFLFQEELAAVCLGDSGGPLIYENKQIGIVSYGSGKCGIFLPDVYVRVSSHVLWIKKQLKKYFDTLAL